MAMAEQDLIDGLIATYRDLNLRVRPLSEERLRLDAGGGSIRRQVRRLRDDELKFSQALKDSLSGIPIPEMFGEEAAVLGTESEDDTTATMLAQFGTARESTLAMLRSLPPMDWDKRLEGTPSVRERVTQLLANDRQHVERIVAMLGSPA